MQVQQSLKAVRVWDLPTRLFHWLLAACVAGSFISVKIGGNAMVWHGRFGFIALSLLLFRIIWGFIGPTHARFSQFVKGPAAIRAELQHGPATGIGHSALGALSVLALLAAFLAQATLGLFTTDDIFYDGPLVKHADSAWVSLASRLHHASEWVLLGLVALHVLAIAFYAGVKKRNLVSAMIQGDQVVPETVMAQASRDDASTRIKAVVLLAACSALIALIAYS